MTINLWDAVCEYYGEDLCVAVAEERYNKMSEEEKEKVLEIKEQL